MARHVFTRVWRRGRRLARKYEGLPGGRLVVLLVRAEQALSVPAHRRLLSPAQRTRACVSFGSARAHARRLERALAALKTLGGYPVDEIMLEREIALLAGDRAALGRCAEAFARLGYMRLARETRGKEYLGGGGGGGGGGGDIAGTPANIV